MANCIIVHGCPVDNEKAKDPERRTYDEHWLPWTKDKLVSMGIPTEIPSMPRPWYPVYEDFRKEFERYDVGEDTVLVGHSCGCSFLVRWLGETKKKIKKLVLVAPVKINSHSLCSEFYDFAVDPHISKRTEIIYFTSDDESDDGKKSLELLHDVLGGKVIEIKGYGHYMEKHMGTVECPELVEEIIA